MMIFKNMTCFQNRLLKQNIDIGMKIDTDVSDGDDQETDKESN